MQINRSTSTPNREDIIIITTTIILIKIITIINLEEIITIKANRVLETTIITSNRINSTKITLNNNNNNFKMEDKIKTKIITKTRIILLNNNSNNINLSSNNSIVRIINTNNSSESTINIIITTTTKARFSNNNLNKDLLDNNSSNNSLEVSKNYNIHTTITVMLKITTTNPETIQIMRTITMDTIKRIYIRMKLMMIKKGIMMNIIRIKKESTMKTKNYKNFKINENTNSYLFLNLFIYYLY